MQIQIARLYRNPPHKQDANNALELIKPLLEKTGIELENILRWEDDGGQIIKVDGFSAGQESTQLSIEYLHNKIYLD